MRAYLERFLKEFSYPQESVQVFLATFDKLAASEEQLKKFNELLECYCDAWRLFDKEYEGDPEAMPRDTSLRRTYVDWMRKGEPAGWGYGYFILQ